MPNKCRVQDSGVWCRWQCKVVLVTTLVAVCLMAWCLYTPVLMTRICRVTWQPRTNTARPAVRGTSLPLQGSASSSSCSTSRCRPATGRSGATTSTASSCSTTSTRWNIVTCTRQWESGHGPVPETRWSVRETHVKLSSTRPTQTQSSSKYQHMLSKIPALTFSSNSKVLIAWDCDNDSMSADPLDWAGTCYVQPTYQFEMSTITCNEEMKGNAKCKK